MKKKYFRDVVLFITFLLTIINTYCHFASLVVVSIDGGITSQMYQYIIGQHMKDLGYTVKYDLRFYEKGTRDNYDEFSRNFELLKAFPYLHVPRVSYLEHRLMKSLFYYKNATSNRFDYLKARPPVYLGGYQYNVDIGGDDSISDLLCYERAPYNKYFHFDESILDAKNKKILERIRQEPMPICVHVRLGDRNGGKRKPIKYEHIAYFARAIAFMQRKFPNAYFFFFSEEPETVRQNILPQLPEGRYEIVDVNKSDEAYKDLFLCSACKHQIMSIGTWRGPAHVLNSYAGKMLITPENIDQWIAQEEKVS
ncbi:MAG: alpha-1,2-fucosyltransferase [Holosporales bacterium]|nr:alpha-1,2-fucosyltransferase [Holosporales bacterium]